MKPPISSPYDPDKLSYKNIIEGNMSPWVMRFIKNVGKAINKFDMIRDKETVLLGVSGGKDSLSLAMALSIRRRWLPIDYNLKAIMINWNEHPIDPAYRPRLEEYFKDLDIDFKIINEPQFPASFKDDFNCYLCSRNRRRILFEIASREGIRQIAMGHHLDDLVETTMMNLFFRAEFATMNPVQEFFDGGLYVIRPLIEIHESVLKRLQQTYDIPVIKPVCPYDQTNIRASLKPIVRDITHIDKLALEHVYGAHDFSDCVIKRMEEGYASVANTSKSSEIAESEAANRNAGTPNETDTATRNEGTPNETDTAIRDENTSNGADVAIRNENTPNETDTAIRNEGSASQLNI